MKKLGLVLIAFLVFMLGAFLLMTNSANKGMQSLIYEPVDMAQVADGEYIGEADSGLVKVKVGVVVKDHSIAGIQILQHENGLGSKAEAITKTMLANNSYQVDAVSGATLSSETIKSAVNRALASGTVQTGA